MVNRRMAASALSIGLLLSAAGTAPAGQGQDDREQKRQRGPLQLPITGIATAPDGTKGTFAGTFSLLKFATPDGKRVVAIGMVRGSVTIDTGDPAAPKTVLAGPISLPVSVEPGGPITTTLAPVGPALAAPATCPALHIALGAANLNVLGLQVATQPIGVDISGDSAGALGHLVCTILDTLNNVVGLVDLLNRLLGVLTGLLGALIP